MPQTPNRVVKAFRGENRLLPDDQLPDTVSPDAQNCDYSRGTIRKRDGFSKLHSDPIMGGGVYINNSTTAKCIYIPYNAAYSFTGDFTVEVFFIAHTLPAADFHILTTNTNKNFALRWVAASNAFQFRWWDSGGTVHGSVWSGITQAKGIRYHAAEGRNGTDARVNVNGTVVGSTTDATGGMTTGSSPFFIGAGNGTTPQNQTCEITVDEIRIWKDYRTDAELAATRYRELNTSEIADTNLVGYWKFNENGGVIIEDSSLTGNHGSIVTTGPCAYPGLMPEGSGDGTCVRFDGIDDYAVALYNTNWAAIMNTGTTFTCEAWLRLDNNTHLSNATLLHLGSTASTGAGQQGPVFQVRCDGTTNAIQVLYATSTTATVTVAVGYTAVPGVPFHIAVVRNGVTNFLVYINGVLYSTTTTGIAASTGPTTSTTYGLYLGANNNAGTYSAFAPCSVDEIRLWNSVRSAQQIQDWMDREYSDSTKADLVGYWRMNTDVVPGNDYGGIQIPNEAGLATQAAGYATSPINTLGDTHFLLGSYQVSRTQGLVYPTTPTPLTLCAPVVRRANTSGAMAATTPVFDREIIATTPTSMWSIVGGQRRFLNMISPSKPDGIFSTCQFQDYTIFCNGAGPNWKYDGTGVPHWVTFIAPITAPSLAASGADGAGDFASGGAVYYKVSYRNSRDGTETLGYTSASVTVSATNHVALTSIPVANAFYTGVDQRVIYRTNPGGSVYYKIGYIYDNSTTAATDYGNKLTVNSIDQTYTTAASQAIYDSNNGHAPFCRYCASHLSRLFLANSPTHPSGIYWTEANSHYKFTATNTIDVNPGDGDEITGMCSAWGGLIIFKRYSIWYLSGSGNTSFDLRQIVQGRGCVAGQTIAQSPYGIYFVAIDGVYRIDSSFGITTVGGFGASPQSFSQQTLFKQINTKKARLATGVYDPVAHQYVCSLDFGLDVNTAFPWAWNIPFTDGTGTTAIDQGRVGGSVTLNGATWTTDTVRGTCLTLPTANYVAGASYPGSTSVGGCISFGAWVYPTSLADKQCVCGLLIDALSVLAHGVIIETTGQISFSATDSGGTVRTVTTTAAMAPVNTWTHIFVSYQFNLMTIYVNGQPVASTRQTLDGLATTGNLSFAFGYPDAAMTGSKYGKARVQYAVAVLSKAVSAQDVTYLYQSQLPGTTLIQGRKTLSYYEEHDAWAYWPVAFDYLSGGSTVSAQYAILGARNSYVNRLKDGTNDGALFGASQLPLTGTLTSGGTTTIVDSAAAFPVSASGQGALQGCYVTMAASASAPSQTRLIVDNTATTIYLDSTFAPTVAGTYTIAGVDWYWASRYMDMGDPINVKRWMWLLVMEKNISDGHTVTFKHRTDQYSTWKETTFTTAHQLVWFMMCNRGRKLQIKFSNAKPGQPIDIEAFEAVFSPRRWN